MLVRACWVLLTRHCINVLLLFNVWTNEINKYIIKSVFEGTDGPGRAGLFLHRVGPLFRRILTGRAGSKFCQAGPGWAGYFRPVQGSYPVLVARGLQIWADIYHKWVSDVKLTLILPRTPLASRVWATKSRNSVSSSADIIVIVNNNNAKYSLTTPLGSA